MARTTLTKTTAPGGYTGAGVVVTMAAADTTDQNQFVSTGKELVIAHNTGASQYTVTINSSDDEYGRQEHISAETIEAGEIKIYGPFPIHGWRQSGSMYIWLEANNVAVELGVIELP